MAAWKTTLQVLPRETVRLLLKHGSSVHETTEDGESLLSLAASAGYYELCQVR